MVDGRSGHLPVPAWRETHGRTCHRDPGAGNACHGEIRLRSRSVPSNLLHPSFMRIRRATSEVNSARGHFHDEQQVVRDQSTLGPHFDGREVDRSQHIPMGFEKGRPRGLSLPIRSRFDSVLLEYVADGRVGDVVANVCQGTLDSVVAPGRVFLGESKDQIDDHLADSRAADASFGDRCSPISWPPASDASAGSCRA